MQKVKVLYVEDELYLGQIVKETLKSRNYDIWLVSDGALVVDAFKNFQPDICVLDVMLPNKDGFTLGKEILELDKEIPIIYLTAKTQAESAIKGLGIGAKDYIRKPFSIEELILRMENVLALSKGNDQDKSIFEFGHFSFSMINFELKSPTQHNTLSYKEAQLLNILLQHKNKKIEREKILKAVWGTDSFVNSRTLDVYINKLRKLLKEDTSINIKTLKGVGYCFIVD